MRKRLLPFLLGLSLLGQPKAPPPTRTDNVRETIHGVEITDPYRWLEDQNSPETRAWIEAQNAYTRPFLDSFPGRAAIQRRLGELMKVDVTLTPAERGGRYFFSRKRADQDQYVIYLRQGRDGKDEPLIDPHPWSADHTVSVNLFDISDDGKVLAYAVRQGGEDEVEVRFFDVDARKELPERLAKARYFGVSIKPDKSGFYYTRHGKEGSRIYYHAFGRQGGDPLIFGEGYGPDKSAFAEVSPDGRYLLIHAMQGSSQDRSEIFFQDLGSGGPIRPVVKGFEHAFFGEIAGGRLYMQTNLKAPNRRILVADLKDPQNWREVVPESKAVIQGFSLAGGKLFVNYLEDVKSRVRIFDADGAALGEIAFPSLGTVTDVSGRWKSNEAFYTFDSFHIPPAIYRYDTQSRRSEVWARQNVPLKSEDFEVRQVWYPSKDGTKIPMFLVHRKGLKLDGARPVLLTGYGGFNIPMRPGFAPQAIAWAEQGGVFALANLRGGSEFGEAWHKAGMLANKQNVFDDFIAAAEWLIRNRYTSPAKLGIRGGSNGGLLMGAMLTQRPDLFGAVVCTYPLLDMIRYHQFLIARFWISEYGSSEDPEQFKWLYSYSPYHHVKKGAKYPAVLFVSGDSDTRVAPLHARKMTALMQASTGSGRPVLLLYDTKTGHSRGMPIGKQIENDTDQLVFLLSQLSAKTAR